MQAKQVAQHIVPTLNNDATMLLVSPYVRCIQTALPLQLPIHVEHGIMEYVSSEPWTEDKLARHMQEPLQQSEYQHALVQDYVPLYNAQKELIPHMPSLWENLPLFRKRLGYTVEQAMDKAETIIMVTHAATAIQLIRLILKDDSYVPRMGVCSVTDLRREQDANQWQVHYNGCKHLESGEIYHWQFP